ncbi:hypothetical protein NDU88_013282 [Pleurodeles waltl]|uniref:Uncharacterized protein n=1 Tax=Pleurodeles waltl TaxID=8319 RepID=A0AAV7R3B4_PLEWA|nr:hypothetical protein NDU88_013282 [Pleurodeles waltl]
MLRPETEVSPQRGFSETVSVGCPLRDLGGGASTPGTSFLRAPEGPARISRQAALEVPAASVASAYWCRRIVPPKDRANEGEALWCQSQRGGGMSSLDS